MWCWSDMGVKEFLICIRYSKGNFFWALLICRSVSNTQTDIFYSYCIRNNQKDLAILEVFSCFFPNKPILQCISYWKLKQLHKRSLVLVYHKEYIGRQVYKGNKQEKDWPHRKTGTHRVRRHVTFSFTNTWRHNVAANRGQLRRDSETSANTQGLLIKYSRIKYWNASQRPFNAVPSQKWIRSEITKRF